MNTKHYFISALDINEQLPFVVQVTENLQETFKAQDKAKKQLEDFIKKLENHFKEEISYLGMDVIGEKSYERFMFKGAGFFEIMIEAPIALNAHFPNSSRAKKFCKALKLAIKQVIPKGPAQDMFLESIEVQGENDDSLTVSDWHKIKGIRD
jgi:hypothetical protein